MSAITRMWEEVRKIDGFLSKDEAELLYSTACVVPQEQMIVEVGAYKGRSTTVLARSGHDVWTVDPMVVGYTDGGYGITREVVEELLANISKHENVMLKRCTSTTVHDPQRSVGLLFIDGDHHAPWPRRDFDRFERHLALTGRVAFHDYIGSNDVHETVDALVKEGRLRIMRRVGSTVLCMRMGAGKAQRGEDVAAINYFGGKVGRFLDVGAWDGVTMSNCRALAEAGWSGVCVEPAVKSFMSLMYNYETFQNVELVHAAIMADHGLSKFWNTDDALSSFSPKHVRVWRDNAGVPFRRIWAPHVTFQTLFEALPGPYDFVSLDAEGFSVTLLQMLDPIRIGAKLVCVENDGRIPEIKMWGNLYGFHQVHRTEENVLMGKTT